MKKICCICGKKYRGYGNNAEPVKEGRCCDNCNRTIVIPKRFIDCFKKMEEKKNEEKI